MSAKPQLKLVKSEEPSVKPHAQDLALEAAAILAPHLHGWSLETIKTLPVGRLLEFMKHFEPQQYDLIEEMKEFDV